MLYSLKYAFIPLAFDPAFLTKTLFIRRDVENAIFFACQIALKCDSVPPNAVCSKW